MAAAQKKMHWFNLAFAITQPGTVLFKGLFVACETKNLSVPVLIQTRAQNNIPEGSCMIGASYLGHMTKDEMNPPPPLVPIKVAATQAYLDGFTVGLEFKPANSVDAPRNPHMIKQTRGEAMPQDAIDWADGFAQGARRTGIVEEPTM